MGIGLKARTGEGLRAVQGVNDLNLVRASGPSSRILRGGSDVRWQARVRAGNGVRPVAHLPPIGREVSRRFQRSKMGMVTGVRNPTQKRIRIR